MAELVSIKRNVDVSPGQAAPAVFHCSQGDVGSKLILGLLNNGTAYSIPSGVTVTIEGSESNGSIFTPISATASESDITFYLTGEMTAVAGPAICQAVLKSGSNILGTANFTLEVESSPMGADAPPVFTDAGWTWMLNKLNTELVPALGNETIIDTIDRKADQSDLTALSNTVAGHTGSITVLNNTVNTLNRSVTENRQNIATKLDKNQGTANAGKYLKVGADGNVKNAELDVTTDKTLSIADKAADAKAVGDELDDLKADLNNIINNEYITLNTGNWEQGTINAVSGLPEASKTRIRTSDFIDISNIKGITFNVASGYKYVVDWYDENDAILQINSSAIWQTTKNTYAEWPGAAKIKLLIATEGNANISPVASVIDKLTVGYSCELKDAIDKSENLRNILDEVFFVKMPEESLWESGGFEAFNNGLPMANNKRIRTNKYVDEKFLSVKTSNDYYVQIWLYDDNDDFYGFISNNYTYVPASAPQSNGLFTNLDLKKVRSLFPNYKIKLTGRNEANARILPFDAGLYYEFEYYETANIKDYATKDYDYLGLDAAIALKKNFTNSISALNNLSTLPIFVHTSDVHGDSVRFKRAYVCAQKLNADAFICTGDFVEHYSSDDFSFVERTVSDIPFVHCLGNHDTFNYATEQSVYEKFIKPFENGYDIPEDINYPTYYYKDLPDKKIRIISVNQFQCVTDSNTSHNTVHFHQEQITWFVNTLLSTPNNYGVIVLIHTPEQKPVIDSTYTKFMQKNVPFFDNVRYKPITEIIDTFISGGILTKTYNNGSGYVPASFSVDADFSFKGSGVEFIAYMSGHMHSDNVSYVPNTSNKQLMLNVVCTNVWLNMTKDGEEGASYPYFNELNDLGRMKDDTTQDAFNVYVIDRENKTVKIARIGANLPYDLSEKRDYMLIPYAD